MKEYQEYYHDSVRMNFKLDEMPNNLERKIDSFLSRCDRIIKEYYSKKTEKYK